MADADRVPERLVPTHCSFCGVQCAMHLRAADGQRDRRGAARLPAQRMLALPEGCRGVSAGQPPRAAALPADAAGRQGQPAGARLG
ncbi:MAG: hypothetical protein U0893_12000 [Chloroflexota bacterium]